MNKTTTLFTILLFFITIRSEAQEMTNAEIDDSGFYVGASLIGTSFSFDIPEFDDETDTGGGIAIEGGYNFNTNFAVFLSLDGSNMSQEEGDNYNFVHFDVGVEGRLGNTESSFRPFGRISLLGAAATFEEDEIEAEISGTGLGLGIGLHYFVNQNFAFKAGYTHGWITIQEFKIESVSFEVDEDATSGRLAIGFTYHF